MKTWSLYQCKPFKEYPSRVYLWVSPNGEVKHAREILPYGYMKAIDTDVFENKTLKDIRKNCEWKFNKVKTNMDEEEMSKGYLIFS